MQVKLVKLEHLLDQVAVGLDAFVERYPGAFLVAAGLLAGEEESVGSDRLIIAPSKPRRDATRERLDFTTIFKFGQSTSRSSNAAALVGSAFHLQPGRGGARATIGRGARCDLTVPDRSVSEVHCRIEVTEQGVVVVDLRSTNGTSINRRRLEPEVPALIADEDILSVGRYSFQMLGAASLHAGLLEVRSLIGDLPPPAPRKRR